MECEPCSQVTSRAVVHGVWVILREGPGDHRRASELLLKSSLVFGAPGTPSRIQYVPRRFHTSQILSRELLCSALFKKWKQLIVPDRIEVNIMWICGSPRDLEFNSRDYGEAFLLFQITRRNSSIYCMFRRFDMFIFQCPVSTRG